jgi:anti-sigma B factor antagonist
MDRLKIESEAGELAGIRILRLSGPFVLKDLFDFQSVARGLTDPVLIIDLTGVPYMDSAALGSIMAVHVSCRKNQRKYGLVVQSERLETLFAVAGVDKILIMYPNLADALNGLKGEAVAN